AAYLVLVALSLGQVLPRRPTPAPTPVPDTVPLMVHARRDRIDRYLLQAMRRANVDSWLVVSREGAVDPLAFDVGAEKAVGRAACLFVDRGEKLESVAVVASFDTDAFQKSGLYTRVVPYGKEGAGPGLKAEIEKYNPKAIAVDESRDAPLAD